jgi:hypothetical protein
MSRNLFVVFFYLQSLAIRGLCNDSNAFSNSNAELSTRYPVLLIPGEARGNRCMSWHAEVCSIRTL